MARKLALFALSIFVLVLTALPLSAQDEFVFGIVLVGPSSDRGWSQAHFEGAQYAEANVEGARMLYFESLNAVDNPQATLMSVTEEMVAEGAQLIITTSEDFEDATTEVAAAFPDVKFVNVTGSNVLEGATENLSNYNAQSEWTAAIDGCAAALASETGNLGYVGPLINPETRRLAVSVYLGARYCFENYMGGNPDDLVFDVAWVGFWFHLGEGLTLNPTELAQTFYNEGKEVVIAAIDTPEPLIVASQRAANGLGGLATGYDFRAACDVAPEDCIGAPFYNWGPYYVRVIEQIRAGEWEQSWTWEQPYWEDINDPDLSPVGFLIGPALSEEDTESLNAFIAELAAFGSDPENAERNFMWQGPLNYADGTEFLAEGDFAEPLEIWFMPQLVEGMTGASE